MDEQEGTRWPQPHTGNDERNRFLTIAMGECWHDFDLGCPVLTCKGGGFICGECHDFVIANNDFEREEDFSKLWEWVNSLPQLRERLGEGKEPLFSDRISRREFADRVYDLLRQERPALDGGSEGPP